MVIEQLPLLDEISRKMECTFLSDLRFLPERRRKQLARKLSRMDPDVNGVQEWNDALAYLTGAPPEDTAAEAKKQLIRLLSHS